VVNGRWYVGKGRLQASGDRGLNQDSGVRMKSIRFPPIAFCSLPTAYGVGRELELPGLLARTAVYDNMSLSKGKEKTSNFKN
jgi:hypothetical protein